MFRLQFNLGTVLVVASSVILAYLGLGALAGGSVTAGAGVGIITLLLTKFGLDKFIDIEGTQNCNIS